MEVLRFHENHGGALRAGYATTNSCRGLAFALREESAFRQELLLAACAAAGIPAYSTPEEAVGGFMQAVHYRRNQQQLMQVPASMPEGFEPKREAARAIIATALAEGRTLLTEYEAKQLLAAHAIVVVDNKHRRESLFHGSPSSSGGICRQKQAPAGLAGR